MTAREVVLSGGSPWGFRMHGGHDLRQLLRISRVNPGSKAAQQGIREGDLITRINGKETRNLTNNESHDILRSAGERLTLGLNQEENNSPKRRIYKSSLQENTSTETLKRITTKTITTNNRIVASERKSITDHEDNDDKSNVERNGNLLNRTTIHDNDIVTKSLERNRETLDYGTDAEDSYGKMPHNNRRSRKSRRNRNRKRFQGNESRETRDEESFSSSSSLLGPTIELEEDKREEREEEEEEIKEKEEEEEKGRVSIGNGRRNEENSRSREVEDEKRSSKGIINDIIGTREGKRIDHVEGVGILERGISNSEDNEVIVDEPREPLEPLPNILASRIATILEDKNLPFDLFVENNNSLDIHEVSDSDLEIDNTRSVIVIEAESDVERLEKIDKYDNYDNYDNYEKITTNNNNERIEEGESKNEEDEEEEPLTLEDIELLRPEDPISKEIEDKLRSLIENLNLPDSPEEARDELRREEEERDIIENNIANRAKKRAILERYFNETRTTHGFLGIIQEECDKLSEDEEQQIRDFINEEIGKYRRDERETREYPIEDEDEKNDNVVYDNVSFKRSYCSSILTTTGILETPYDDDDERSAKMFDDNESSIRDRNKNDVFHSSTDERQESSSPPPPPPPPPPPLPLPPKRCFNLKDNFEEDRLSSDSFQLAKDDRSLDYSKMMKISSSLPRDAPPSPPIRRESFRLVEEKLEREDSIIPSIIVPRRRSSSFPIIEMEQKKEENNKENMIVVTLKENREEDSLSISLTNDNCPPQNEPNTVEFVKRLLTILTRRATTYQDVKLFLSRFDLELLPTNIRSIIDELMEQGHSRDNESIEFENDENLNKFENEKISFLSTRPSEEISGNDSNEITAHDDRLFDDEISRNNEYASAKVENRIRGNFFDEEKDELNGTINVSKKSGKIVDEISSRKIDFTKVDCSTSTSSSSSSSGATTTTTTPSTIIQDEQRRVFEDESFSNSKTNKFDEREISIGNVIEPEPLREICVKKILSLPNGIRLIEELTIPKLNIFKNLRSIDYHAFERNTFARTINAIDENTIEFESFDDNKINEINAKNFVSNDSRFEDRREENIRNDIVPENSDSKRTNDDAVRDSTFSKSTRSGDWHVPSSSNRLFDIIKENSTREPSGNRLDERTNFEGEIVAKKNNNREEEIVHASNIDRSINSIDSIDTMNSSSNVTRERLRAKRLVDWLDLARRNSKEENYYEEVRSSTRTKTINGKEDYFEKEKLKKIKRNSNETGKRFDDHREEEEKEKEEELRGNESDSREKYTNCKLVSREESFSSSLLDPRIFEKDNNFVRSKKTVVNDNKIVRCPTRVNGALIARNTEIENDPRPSFVNSTTVGEQRRQTINSALIDDKPEVPPKVKRNVRVDRSCIDTTSIFDKVAPNRRLPNKINDPRDQIEETKRATSKRIIDDLKRLNTEASERTIFNNDEKKRYSLPSELFQRQLNYIEQLENQLRIVIVAEEEEEKARKNVIEETNNRRRIPREVGKDFEEFEREINECESSRSTINEKYVRDDEGKRTTIRNDDTYEDTVKGKDNVRGGYTKETIVDTKIVSSSKYERGKDSSIDRAVPTNGEQFRERMYNEYVDKVHEREERKHQRVIKITSRPNSLDSGDYLKKVNGTFDRDINTREENRRSVTTIEGEFIERAKIRLNKFGIKLDESEEEEGGHREEEYLVDRANFVIDGNRIIDETELPRHLREFLRLSTQLDEARRNSNGTRDLLHEIDNALKFGKGFLLGEENNAFSPTFKATASRQGIWTPGSEQPLPRGKESSPDRVKEGDSTNEKDGGIPPVWSPSASPIVERKEFRSVPFESPILNRKNKSSESQQSSTERVAPPPPWEGEDRKREASHILSDNLTTRVLDTRSTPGQGSSNLANLPRLPRAQNPTITLLQKAREGQLPKGASYLEESTTYDVPITIEEKPTISPGEIIYTVKKEYESEPETEQDKPKKMADLGPRKFEGIGPTTKEGIPLVLRSEVKEDNQAKWYKKMYDSLHRADNDEDYVTIRYKPRRGARYGYGSASGYLSEPEPHGHGTERSATLDGRRRQSNKKNAFATSTIPRKNVTIKNHGETYRNQPGRIEDYEPGKSSIADRETKEWWDEVMDIFDGPFEAHDTHTAKPYASRGLKESGYESDSTLVFRRREEANPLSPLEQRLAYKTVQRGGDVPLHGLRKPAPERPKDDSTVEYFPISPTLTRIHVRRRRNASNAETSEESTRFSSVSSRSPTTTKSYVSTTNNEPRNLTYFARYKRSAPSLELSEIDTRIARRSRSTPSRTTTDKFPRSILPSSRSPPPSPPRRKSSRNNWTLIRFNTSTKSFEKDTTSRYRETELERGEGNRRHERCFGVEGTTSNIRFLRERLSRNLERNSNRKEKEDSRRSNSIVTRTKIVTNDSTDRRPRRNRESLTSSSSSKNLRDLDTNDKSNIAEDKRSKRIPISKSYPILGTKESKIILGPSNKVHGELSSPSNGNLRQPSSERSTNKERVKSWRTNENNGGGEEEIFGSSIRVDDNEEEEEEEEKEEEEEEKRRRGEIKETREMKKMKEVDRKEEESSRRVDKILLPSRTIIESTTKLYARGRDRNSKGKTKEEKSVRVKVAISSRGGGGGGEIVRKTSEGRTKNIRNSSFGTNIVNKKIRVDKKDNDASTSKKSFIVRGNETSITRRSNDSSSVIENKFEKPPSIVVKCSNNRGSETKRNLVDRKEDNKRKSRNEKNVETSRNKKTLDIEGRDEKRKETTTERRGTKRFGESKKSEAKDTTNTSRGRKEVKVKHGEIGERGSNTFFRQLFLRDVLVSGSPRCESRDIRETRNNTVLERAKIFQSVSRNSLKSEPSVGSLNVYLSEKRPVSESKFKNIEREISRRGRDIDRPIGTTIYRRIGRSNDSTIRTIIDDYSEEFGSVSSVREPSPEYRLEQIYRKERSFSEPPLKITLWKETNDNENEIEISSPRISSSKGDNKNEEEKEEEDHRRRRRCRRHDNHESIPGTTIFGKTRARSAEEGGERKRRDIIDSKLNRRKVRTSTSWYDLSRDDKDRYVPIYRDETNKDNDSRYSLLREGKSKRYKDLYEFYASLERVGELERTASKGELGSIGDSPILVRDRKIIDYDIWKRLRTKERAEKELKCLYGKLLNAQRDKDFLFRPKEVDQFRWKGDSGLRCKEKSVEDIREQFGRLENQDIGNTRMIENTKIDTNANEPRTRIYRGKREVKSNNDLYKPLWRGNSVASVARAIDERLGSSFDKISSNEKSRKPELPKNAGISRKLWSSLSVEQMNALKNQLNEIYSNDSGTIPSRVRCSSASSSSVPVRLLLDEKDKSRFVNRVESIDVCRGEMKNNNVSRVRSRSMITKTNENENEGRRRVSSANGGRSVVVERSKSERTNRENRQMSEIEKKRLSLTLSKEVLDKVKEKKPTFENIYRTRNDIDFISPRETRAVASPSSSSSSPPPPIRRYLKSMKMEKRRTEETDRTNKLIESFVHLDSSERSNVDEFEKNNKKENEHIETTKRLACPDEDDEVAEEEEENESRSVSRISIIPNNGKVRNEERDSATESSETSVKTVIYQERNEVGEAEIERKVDFFEKLETKSREKSDESKISRESIDERWENRENNNKAGGEVRIKEERLSNYSRSFADLKELFGESESAKYIVSPSYARNEGTRPRSVSPRTISKSSNNRGITPDLIVSRTKIENNARLALLETNESNDYENYRRTRSVSPYPRPNSNASSFEEDEFIDSVRVRGGGGGRRGESPDPERYWQTYLKLVRNGVVKKLREKFESLEELSEDRRRRNETRPVPKRFRSDPELTRDLLRKVTKTTTTRNEEENKIIVRGQEIGDVDWLRRKYEPILLLRPTTRRTKKFFKINESKTRGRVTSPIPKIPLRLERLGMPRINVISKLAELNEFRESTNLRPRTTNIVPPPPPPPLPPPSLNDHSDPRVRKITRFGSGFDIDDSIESSIKEETMKMIKKRENIEYEDDNRRCSIMGEMFTSTPNIRELGEIGYSYLAGEWIAHKYPKRSDNAKRCLSSPELDHLRCSRKDSRDSSTCSAWIENRSKNEQSTGGTTTTNTNTTTNTTTTTNTNTNTNEETNDETNNEMTNKMIVKGERGHDNQDPFANQVFDPSKHRPKSRYEPLERSSGRYFRHLSSTERRSDLVREETIPWWPPIPTYTARPTVTFEEYEGAPPPPPKAPHCKLDRQESPRRYVEGEVTIHYRSPVRTEAKEILSEAELARRSAENMRRVYQEERRRKYLQELNDIDSRRHTDNFTPSQKSPIPLNRYDDFVDDLGEKIESREETPEPRLIARALYNFVGQSSRELTFRRGDVIFVRRRVDKNWYEGEHNAMIGLFPFNYVEIIPYDGIKITSTPKKPHEGEARAKFNFIAQTSHELSLAKGDLVVLTRRIDGNWYEGRIGARKGIFPISYVQVIAEPGIHRETIARDKPVAAPAAHSLLSNGSAGGKLSMGPHHYTPSIPTKPNVTQPRYNSLPRIGGTKLRVAPVNETLHIDTQSEPTRYRALYNYRPQNDDELELKEGDTVYVMEKCDDGWFVGSSHRTGFFGTFPGNYVERLRD